MSQTISKCVLSSSSQCMEITQLSKQTMTEHLFDTCDKSIVTESMNSSRHVQTWNTSTENKKSGPGPKLDMSTQVTAKSHMSHACQTPPFLYVHAATQSEKFDKSHKRSQLADDEPFRRLFYNPDYKDLTLNPSEVDWYDHPQKPQSNSFMM